MQPLLYSLRMRATRNGQHVSGAERIVPTDAVVATSAALIDRALQTPAGRPDDVHCRVEALDPEQIASGTLPDLYTWQAGNVEQGRRLAGELLRGSGVSTAAIASACRAIATGAAGGGGNMRGMMIVDACSGERLEPDRARGLRVSRMDLAPAAREPILEQLTRAGLGHHRVAEALVLAGKALQTPGAVAELCWSDAPDYLTGYVAGPDLGYQRITPLKESGDPCGGRALFVDRARWHAEDAVAWLERRPVLFDAIGTIHPPRTWPEQDDFLG